MAGDPVWYLSDNNWLPGWYYNLIGPYALPDNPGQPIWRDVVTMVKGSTNPDDHVTLSTHDQVKVRPLLYSTRICSVQGEKSCRKNPREFPGTRVDHLNKPAYGLHLEQWQAVGALLF
ncbi:hypothetical protein K438DRAFT_1758981 [Mycena galopus ATCC 62051]|nr:hypothetical protein K438DRAFT_1758981 [Mycena galopus ATCC 62051]